MKIVIIIILTILSMFSFGQETKKVKVKISSNENEIYYVLKDDENIKHGQYQLFHNKWLKISGYYSNNLKDSIWTEYIYTGDKIWEGEYKDGTRNGMWTTFSLGKIETNGKYKNDKRIGIWGFYNKKGVLVQKFDFEKNKIIFLDTTDFNPTFSIQGGIYDGLMYVDTLPTYKSGETELFQFIVENTQYPIEAKEKGISGIVYISILVNEKGELSNFEVYKGIEGGCNEEAIRVLKMTSGNWNSALFNGQKVAIRMMMPLRFSLK